MTPHYTIREPSQGVVVWEGDYATAAQALAAYRAELGPEAREYDDVDPDWENALEIEHG